MAKRNRSFLYIVFIILSVLVLTEIGLRILGYRVYETKKINLRFSPRNCFRTDSVWGIGLEPGKYTVTINEGLSYYVTHTADGGRSCGDTSGKALLPEWVFLGCSMTYGMGVDDTCTYPYLIQKALPDVRVSNLAIPGTGGLHQYLRLKDYLEKGHRPAAVFFSYLDFHDSRNVFSSATAKMLGSSITDNKRPAGSSLWGYAYARKEAGNFQIHIKDLSRAYSPLPGTRISVLINRVQQMIDNRKDAQLPMAEVSRHYILLSRDLCAASGIAFTVVFMKRGGNHEAVWQFCADHHIPVLDLSVDFSDPTMTNQPYDGHPSPRAHHLMAEKFMEQLHAPIAPAGQ